MKDIFKKSMLAMQTLAKIIKHTRRSRGWETARVVMESPQAQVLVLNDRGEELAVPADFFRWYQQMPPRLLVKMTSVVRPHRVLTIRVAGNEPDDDVVVEERDKSLFDDSAEDDIEEDILFPELAHGTPASLDGRLIRGSEASNSVGLEYQGHVINCVPSHGNVRQYKPALFLRCRVTGRITRQTKSRFVADRRPSLIIETVIPLESDIQQSLFDA